MQEFWKKMQTGFKWLSGKVTEGPELLKKVFVVGDEVKSDAAVLLPAAETLFADVDKLAVASVKDCGSALASLDTLAAAIAAAATAKGLNIIEDEAVVSAVEAFAKEVTNSKNFSDVISAAKQLVVDYDALGALAKEAVARLEADIKS